MAGKETAQKTTPARPSSLNLVCGPSFTLQRSQQDAWPGLLSWEWERYSPECLFGGKNENTAEQQ